MRRLLPLLLAAAFLAVPAPAGSATVPTTAAGGDVFVVLKEEADLSAVRRQRGHAARVSAAHRALTGTAERSQQGVRALLKQAKARFTPYWIVNSILVRNATPELIGKLARRAEVARVRPAGSIKVPEPTPAQAAAQVAGVEWGISKIGATRVWSELGVRGEGVVVGNIDTGVQFDHPALAGNYRGRKADGSYDHNYNWADPASVCGFPSPAPCDNHGHGTHTMGTIAGGEGIGVAPGATWVAAKGCEASSCSDAALLAAGQWMIAPTDLSGANPRPDLAPHIVSNSWGAFGEDPFYQGIVDSWVDAGIFPVFAGGNDGPDCATAHSPGSYANTYAVGASGADGQIADFSSRGDPESELIKPDIVAPGVAVRSAMPGGGYAAMSGTSMATPHVAGAIALIWSAAPGLRGDVAATRALLDESAIDTEDYACGGTKDDNRVWGQGSLDAFAAATFAPRGTLGTLTGTVTTQDGTALPDAKVTLGVAGASRTIGVDSGGRFSVGLSPGAYQVTANAFGFAAGTVAATVTAGATADLQVRLDPVPRYDLYGEIRQPGGEPLPNAVVYIDGTPYPEVTTGLDGTFVMYGVPRGTWRVTAKAARCAGATAQSVVVDGDRFVAFEAPHRKDKFGNKCEVRPSLSWVDGADVLPLTGDDAASAVTLPFTFPLYGRPYTKAYVSTNGFVNFQRLNPSSINGAIPSGGLPNAAIYAFWDDLMVDASASVRTTSSGEAPNRRFVIEWRNVSLIAQPSARLTFSLELHENGHALIQYKSLPVGKLPRGGGATIGLENGLGSMALDYSVDQQTLRPGMGIRFFGAGVVQGLVKDVAGTALPGLEVSIVRTSDAYHVSDAVTDSQGAYRLYVPQGAYAVVVTDPAWEYSRTPVVIDAEGQVTTADITLYPPDNTLTGHVRDAEGRPMSGVTVAVQDRGVGRVTTGSDGAFTLEHVHGGRQVLQAYTGPCAILAQRVLTVSGDTEVQLTAGTPLDPAGFGCVQRPKAYVEGVDILQLPAPSDANAVLQLPFAFPIAGTTFTQAWASTNGAVIFYDATTGVYAMAYAFLEPLLIDEQAAMRTATLPDGRFVVEWRNALIRDTSLRVTFEAILGADGKILLQYGDLPDDPRARGSEGLTGVYTSTGDSFYVWPPLDPALALEIYPDPWN